LPKLLDPDHVLSYLPKHPIYVSAKSIAADINEPESYVSTAIEKLASGRKNRTPQEHEVLAEGKIKVLARPARDGLEYSVSVASWDEVCRRSERWLRDHPGDAPQLAQGGG